MSAIVTRATEGCISGGRSEGQDEAVALTVLYVCTGNVCRSPAAERLLRSVTARNGDVVVGSAGVEALVGEDMDGPSGVALAERGLSAEGHRARQFRTDMAAAADLVLTAERFHRDFVIADTAGAWRHTFTMCEFVRLARHVPDDDDPRRTIARIAALRGVDGNVPLSVDDIPDPFRRSLTEARAVVDRIAATVTTTVRALRLVTDLADPSPAAEDVHRASPRPRRTASVAARPTWQSPRPAAPAARRPSPSWSHGPGSTSHSGNFASPERPRPLPRRPRPQGDSS